MVPVCLSSQSTLALLIRVDAAGTMYALSAKATSDLLNRDANRFEEIEEQPFAA